MSNRIDYYEGIEKSLSIPAGRGIVFIDGVLSEFLDVKAISLKPSPDYGIAKFGFDNAGFEVLANKNMRQFPAVGKCVEVFDVYDSGEGLPIPNKRRTFLGWIESAQSFIGSDDDINVIVARDYSTKLEKIAVSGRRVYDKNENYWSNGFSLVFNEDGKGNASNINITRQGNTSRIFTLGSDGIMWSCADAVRYLLAEHLPAGAISIPPTGLIESIMGEAICDELDVDGDSLLTSLEKICATAGVLMRFVPCSKTCRPRLSFYKPGQNGQVELDMQFEGEGLNLSKTQIAKVKRKSAFWPITHRYYAQGERKVFESTFELVGAWDFALEGKTQEEYRTNHVDFQINADVYRKWCLNETGKYSLAPYNSGEMFDLTSIDSEAVFLGGPKKFQNCISIDQEGNNYGIYIEVSYDGGSSWNNFTGEFDNLTDECGIYISGSLLEDNYYNAAISGLLRLRVTAAIESDERLMYFVADGPVDSIVEVRDHFIETRGVYEYLKVCGGSIFYQDGAGVNDSEKLVNVLRNSANRIIHIIETIDIETPFLRTGISVGDRVISNPSGRGEIGELRDIRSVFWLERVTIDYKKQTTQLRILRKRHFDV